nr:hypothetical protein JVH1_8715 [Rhodococcus sp. JVH1]
MTIVRRSVLSSPENVDSGGTSPATILVVNWTGSAGSGSGRPRNLRERGSRSFGLPAQWPP